MKTAENFSTRNLNLFNFENYRLEQLETENQKNKHNLTIIGAIAVGIIVLMYYYEWYIAGAIALALEIVIYFILRWQIKKVYKLAFKNTVLTKMVQSIDESFNYIPQNSISKTEFSDSNFFKGVSGCTGEDYFTGQIEGKQFKGSEVTIETGSGKQRSIVFKGMFFVVDFPINEDISIEILPDTAEKAFGTFGKILQSINFMRNSLIKIDNQPFENNFVIYTNNENKAREIITNDLANCLLSLNEQFNSHIFLSFNKSKMYFGVNNRNDIFKVDINQSLLDNELILQYFKEFYQYIEALESILKKIT